MAEDLRCPQCGSKMAVRTAKKGPNAGRRFYVCTRYPDCKGKVALSDYIPRWSQREIGPSDYGREDSEPSFNDLSMKGKVAFVLVAPFAFIWVTIVCLLPMAITGFLIWFFFFS